MKWFRKHKILTAFVLILLLLLLLIGTVVGFVWSKLRLIQYDDGTLKEVYSESQSTGPEETEPAEEAGPGVDISGLEEMETFPVIPEAEIQEKDDVVNILVLGTDERSIDLSENARSDSMILVSIDKTNKTVKLVSLERGMGVYMETGMMAGEYDLLTHAFRWGGADLVCDCVETNLRVEVDHYVRVNFTTVRTVVDAIGGIDMELTEAEASVLGQFVPGLKTGMNHLDGDAALRFARLRSIDSDWQRVERQRKVILAAVDALKGASLKELNNLLDQTLPLIQTDMSMLDIAEMMLYAPNFLTSEFDQMTIPKQGTYGYKSGIKGFAVDYEVNSQILRDFLYGAEEEASE